jgi:rRNA-processing protein FCF1
MDVKYDKTLLRTITAHGGTTCERVCSATTHVVSLENDSEIARKAKTRGIPVVDTDWITNTVNRYEASIEDETDGNYFDRFRYQ